MSEVNRILSLIESGDTAATAQLLPLVYDELRRLAVARLIHERPGYTLQATDLVHEAFLRLVGDNRRWDSLGHFFVAAAEAMRRILVERARHKAALKSGGGRQRVDIEHVSATTPGPSFDLLALDEALTKLERSDRRKAELVKLRFFSGLTNQQAAKALGISTSTADNEWAYARCWLRLQMSDDG